MADLSKLRFNGTDYNVKDASAPLRKFTNYSKTGNLPITSDDTTQTAIGKLEKALDSKINTSAKGTASGVAELDANGKVPSSQLPSYVDDVLEYSAKSSFPATGETGKIYIDTSTNKTYRWSGSAYVEISESLALGETSSTAYRGDRGKTAYDHSQSTHARTDATKTEISNGKLAINGTATDIGNFKAVSTVASQGLSDTEKSNSRTNIGAQASLTTAQLAAVNSGIDSTKVGQISTNQTNILSVQNDLLAVEGNKIGVNNFNIGAYVTNPDITVVGDSLTVNKTVTLPITVPKTGKYYLLANVSNVSVGSGGSAYLFIRQSTTNLLGITFSTTGDISGEFTVTDVSALSFLFSFNSASVTIKDIMIVSEEAYNAGFTNYQPYALPNYDLTQREQQDRNALVECVDNGTKNKLDFSSLEYADGHGAPTVTKTDTTITIASGNAWARAVYSGIYLKAGTYVLSVNITSATFATGIVGTIRIVDNAWATGGVAYMEFNSIGKVSCIFTVDTEADLYFSFCPNYSGGDLSTANSFTATDVMICTEADWNISQNYAPFALPNTDLTRMMTPFFTVPINHNMIYRGQNLGDTLTADQDTALSSGNFTDLYLGDYWTKSVTIPDFYELTTAEPSDWATAYTSYYTKSGDTYTAVTGSSAPTWAADTYYQKSVPAQTVTLKAVIADFDTFYAGYASTYAAINTHHAAVIVAGFSNVVWNKTDSTAGGYVNSLIHKWLVGSVLPQIEAWFGSAKVLSHQKLLTNAITGDAASGWAWSSQKISLLSENQMYGSKVWGNSKAANGGYEPGEAFKKLDVFNHIDANLLFGNKNIWCRDIASAERAADLISVGSAYYDIASNTWLAPAALILLS